MPPRFPRPPLRLVSVPLLLAAVVADLAAQPTDEAAKGQPLFAAHCSICHGPQGEGGRGPTLAQPVLPRASDAASLRKIIAAGIPGTEMPASQLAPDQIGALATFVKSLGSRPVELVPGDTARGAQLYATKGGCALCHSIQGRGGAIGPDLTVIGRRRSAAHLRRSLVEPAAEVPQSYNPFRAEISLPENFLFVRVTARDGRSVAGVRVNEDTFSLQLRDLGGQVHSFFKSDLTELHKDRGLSPMPAYGAVFTPGELDDVVAFLVSLRGAAPAVVAEKTNQTDAVSH